MPTERGIDPGASSAAHPEDDTLDLVRYWRAINRVKWRLMLLVLLVGVLATLIAFSLKPVYRGTTTILVEQNKPKIVSFEEVYNMASGMSREFYQTQLEILKSRQMVARLVSDLKPADHPLFAPRQQDPPVWRQWAPEGFLDAAGPAALKGEATTQSVIQAVQRGLDIQLVRNSALIRIGFRSTDRALAARVPNRLAELFIDSDLEARMKMTERATSFLNSQTAELRKRLQESEAALQSFRERERIIDVKGVSLAGASKQLEGLTAALIEARRKRAEAENVYNQITATKKSGSGDSLESLSAIQRHPQFMSAKDRESEADKRRAEASKRFGKAHPKMVAAEAEYKAAREALNRGISAVAQSVEREYALARANEASVERALATAKGDIQSLNRKEFGIAALERDVSNNRQLYEMFIQRFKETNISGEIRSAIARVVDPAIVPEGPYGPNKQLIVGLSTLGALLLAMALALLVERLNNTIKSSQDVETKLGIPLLGIVQKAHAGRGKSIERAFLDDPQTSFSEAIRSLRSAVMLSSLDNPKKVVAVTSAVPSEGKTTIATNLAYSLGQLKKTLLIDADMRRPRIGQMLGIKQPLPGLSELCAGEAKLDVCIYQVRDTNVFVIPAGKLPPNPQEMLASNRFAEVLKQLCAQYEIIVIDTPPVQLVSDVLVLPSVVSEVVFVVKADETPYPLARGAIRKLLRANAPVIGAVLNMLDIVKADKYEGEYSGYGRRYHGKKYGYGYTGKA